MSEHALNVGDVVRVCNSGEGRECSGQHCDWNYGVIVEPRELDEDGFPHSNSDDWFAVEVSNGQGTWFYESYEIEWISGDN